MLKKIFFVLLVFTAGYFLGGNDTEKLNPNPSKLFAYLDTDSLNKNLNTDGNKEQSLESLTTTVDSTELNSATQVDNIVNTTESIVETICVDPTSKNCKLREDVKIIDTLFYSTNIINDDAVWVILFSENYQEFSNQLSNDNQDQYSKEKAQELREDFGNLYQEFPDIINNDLGCESGICAASFSLTDSKSLKDLSAKVEQMTNIPNGVIYITNGYDQSGNYQARYMFSISEKISAVTIEK